MPACPSPNFAKQRAASPTRTQSEGSVLHNSVANWGRPDNHSGGKLRSPHENSLSNRRPRNTVPTSTNRRQARQQAPGAKSNEWIDKLRANTVRQCHRRILLLCNKPLPQNRPDHTARQRGELPLQLARCHGSMRNRQLPSTIKRINSLRARGNNRLRNYSYQLDHPKTKSLGLSKANQIVRPTAATT